MAGSSILPAGGADKAPDRGASRQVLYAALVSPTRVQNGGDGDESDAPPHLNLNDGFFGAADGDAPRRRWRLGPRGCRRRPGCIPCRRRDTGVAPPLSPPPPLPPPPAIAAAAAAPAVAAAAAVAALADARRARARPPPPQPPHPHHQPPPPSAGAGGTDEGTRPAPRAAASDGSTRGPVAVEVTTQALALTALSGGGGPPAEGKDT